MNELIERAAGKSSSSVSKRTSLLVAGEGPGSSARAEDPDVRIVTPDAFAELVLSHLPHPSRWGGRG